MDKELGVSYVIEAAVDGGVRETCYMILKGKFRDEGQEYWEEMSHGEIDCKKIPPGVYGRSAQAQKVPSSTSGNNDAGKILIRHGGTETF